MIRILLNQSDFKWDCLTDSLKIDTLILIIKKHVLRYFSNQTKSIQQNK
ncbi:hypothetical protein CDIMF43_110142 [Carnobacterium divergens]|nr:hypothetical protein CDIV41_270200 [Carnobacterium divergens]SPC36421.1 hypothetical protein CDIMF43_110142 [Carnobacterium divergens]